MATMDELEIGWRCGCGHRNSDSFTETTAPLCASCDELFEWEQVLTENEIRSLNTVVDVFQCDI